MGEQIDALRAHLREIRNIQKAASVLSWDLETMMPPGGSRARGEQLATLQRLSHSMFTSDGTGSLISAAEGEAAGLPYDGNDASLVRWARREYERSRKIPADFVAEFARHSTHAHEVWVDARKRSDYAAFAPELQKTVEMTRQRAEYLGYQDNRYDALLDLFEPGMKTAQVKAVFDELRSQLVPLVAAIAERADAVSEAPVHQPFDEAKQEQFGLMIAAAIGYDFTRGRQDRAVHPFETAFSRDDVRITTRFDPNFLNPALFGTMHESGHAMYEQGVGEELEGTPLARGCSSALHESQSRLWENVVGRSRAFWQHFYPRLQETFPDQLGAVSLDEFYRAINRVEPSFIRVEADEVTYTLHIMLRFEMELGLLDGSIPVHDAPAAWNQKMRDYLGVTPPDDANGILQDIHWSSGMFGYFPTYALGTILSLQIYDTAVASHPEIPAHLAEGRFDTLLCWLTEHVYRHGRKFLPNELIERATGRPLEIAPYMRYLRDKFGGIYGLAEA